MILEEIIEPKDGILKYSTIVAKDIMKELNFQNYEDRVKAVTLIQEWIKQQDHFLKKDFGTAYIERSIATCKGSLERTKKQIDRICTLKTLLPKYFQITNIKESELMSIFKIVEIAILPQLTEEYYRVVIVKVRPNKLPESTHQYTLFYTYLIILGEYLKSNDCCRGYVLINDFYDTSASALLSKVNLIEVQQMISILTEGYGCRAKAILLVTGSKFIESFIKLVKPLFSEKIGNRIHAVSEKKSLQSLINGNILPKDYGGPEKSVTELHEKLIECISSPTVQELLTEMNKAATDESKRRTDKFNDDCMGMPGTFRTLSLD